MNWQDIKDELFLGWKKEVGKVVRINTQLQDCKYFKSPIESEAVFYVDEAVIGLLIFLLYTERPRGV